MTKILEQAIEKVRTLPESEQEAAGAALMDHLSAMQDLQLSDEQVAEVRRRRSKPSREFLTLAEVRARLRHLGV